MLYFTSLVYTDLGHASCLNIFWIRKAVKEHKPLYEINPELTGLVF